MSHGRARLEPPPQRDPIGAIHGLASVRPTSATDRTPSQPCAMTGGAGRMAPARERRVEHASSTLWSNVWPIPVPGRPSRGPGARARRDRPDGGGRRCRRVGRAASAAVPAPAAPAAWNVQAGRCDPRDCAGGIPRGNRMEHRKIEIAPAKGRLAGIRVHPADQAEERAALPDGRGTDQASWRRMLRIFRNPR